MFIELFISSILGLLIGAVVAILLFGLKRENILKDVGVAVLVAIACTLITATWKIRRDVASINRWISTTVLTDGCSFERMHFSDDIFNAVASALYAEMQRKCFQIPSKTVELSPQEDQDIWAILVTNASRSIKATNIIASDYWPSLACETQKAASQNSVIIERVMLLERSDQAHNDSLAELAMRQMGKCGVKRVLYYYKDNLYRNFKKHINALEGAIDFVLVDDYVLLITAYDKANKAVTKGWVTTDDDKVLAAKEFFDQLFVVSTPYPNNQRGRAR